MATQNKSLETPANGADVNTWDTPINANSTTIDAAFGGQALLNVTGIGTGPTALTLAQYQNMSLSFSGTLANNVNYQLPANVQGQWVVINGTTGAFTLTISSATGVGSTVSVSQGNTRSIYCDGTNVIFADSQPQTSYTVPTGAVMAFAMSTAPANWLECNGSAVSRTTYATLFSAIGTAFGSGDGSTTFNVPDMRGEFARGWDNGAGVDPGRVFGTTQAAAMLNHTHSGTTSSVGDHTHTLPGQIIFGNGSPTGTSIAAGPGSNLYQSNITGAAGGHNHTVTTGNPSAGGGSETRPTNVAFLYCIRT